MKNMREKSHPKVSSHFPIDFKMETNNVLLQLLTYFTLEISWKTKLLENEKYIKMLFTNTIDTTL